MLCTHRIFTNVFLFGHCRTIAIECTKTESEHKCWHCEDENHQVLGHKFTTEEYRNGRLTEEEKDILAAYANQVESDNSFEDLLDLL